MLITREAKGLRIRGLELAASPNLILANDHLCNDPIISQRTCSPELHKPSMGGVRTQYIYDQYTTIMTRVLFTSDGSGESRLTEETAVESERDF